MFDTFLKKPFYQLLLIFSLTALAYCNILPNQFLNFEVITSPKTKVLFTLSFQQQEWSYLGKETARVISYLIGSAPSNFHFLSILLHLTNIFVIYKIVYRMSSKYSVAFAAALLFGIHPAQTETVSQATNFMILLGGLGIFGSFYYFLKSQDAKSGTNLERLISLMLAALSGLLFKQALIYPFLIFFYTALKKGSYKEALPQAAPYALIVALIFLVSFLMPATGSTDYLNESIFLNVLMAIKAFGRYVITALVPFALSYNPILSEGVFSRFPEDFDKYAFLTQSIIDLAVLVTMILSSILFIFLKYMGKKNQLILWGGIWFAICLIPGLSLFPTQIFYSESFLYISNFGYVLILGLVFSSLLENPSLSEGKKFFVWLLLVTLVLFGVVQSWMRNLDWRNDKRFYAAAVQSNPQSYLMQLKLARAYIDGLESDKGIVLLNEMLLKHPQKTELYILLAQGYKNFNQYKKSVSMLEKAIIIDPQNADAYFRLSEIYALWEMHKPAYENLDRAIYYYKKQGQLEEAQRIEGILKQFADNPDNFNQTSP